MAIIKQIGTEYGIVAEYHKIILTSVDWLQRHAQIVVGTYVNKELRFQNAGHIAASAFSYNAENFPFTFAGDFMAEGYAAIKQAPQFEGASDDL